MANVLMIHPDKRTGCRDCELAGSSANEAQFRPVPLVVPFADKRLVGQKSVTRGARAPLAVPAVNAVRQLGRDSPASPVTHVACRMARLLSAGEVHP